MITTDTDPGNLFLECAVAIAQSIDGLEERSEVISRIAVKYAESDQPEVAVDLAETINDSFLRDQALAWIAAKCVEIGDAEYAEELAETIQEDTAYALATEQMAVAYAEAGAFEKSIEVAHRLSESAPTLSRIALVGVAGDLNVQALEVARSIDYPDLKAPILVELAAKALNDGRNPEAFELLQEAAEAAEKIEFSEQRTSTLTAIASLKKKGGHEDQALEVLSRAHHLCSESEDFAKDANLAQIAGGFAELQRYDQADRVIEEIEHPFQFAHATARVALECHKTGNSEKALTLLADAMETVRDEDVYGEQTLLMRESLLDELAVCYAIVGHYEEALQITGWLNSQDQQHRTLGQIASRAVRSGNNARAFQASEMIKDNYARVLCDIEIVDAFISSGQMELADHRLNQAHTRTATVERAYQKALALVQIASRFAREQTAKALEVLFEALGAVAAISDSYHQSQTLLNLAVKYRELGQPPGQREQMVLEEMRFKRER
jgi:tetratricopeptide (TPR) repeat protein